MGSTTLSLTTLLPLLALGLTIVVQTGVICYAMGRLFQRVTSAEKRLAEQDVQIEKKIGDQNAILMQMAEMRVEQRYTKATLEKVCHTLENVSHQLSNLAMNRTGKLYEIGPSE